MASRCERRGRWRWPGLAALGVTAAALGLGGVRVPASADEGSGPADAFGGFSLKGRANGIQLTYNVENVFPLPPPLFQLSVPEAVATTVSGPTATAFGSSAYPGDVVGNLPAIVEQSSPGNGEFVPPYPLQARADHPAGPPEATQDIGTVSTRVVASEDGADAVTSMAPAAVPGLISFGAVTTTGHTGFENGQVVARSRAEFASIDLLFGLIHLEGVVTDLVATSDGVTAATDGSTTVAAASVLGLPATVGPDGVVVSEVAAPPNPGPAAPIHENAAGPLGQLGAGLSSGLAPVNQAVQDLLGTAGGSVNDLLAASGVRIGILEPVSVVDGPEASITGNGLVIDISYDGRGDNPLAQLLAAIPTEQLPGEGIPGLPLNTSPQALVGLLKETHVTGVALAYGTAEVAASPGYSFTARAPMRSPATGLGSGGGRTGSAGASAARIAAPTPTPSLGGAGGGAGATTLAASPAAGLGGAAVGAFAVILTLLSSPLWAIGSRRLADGVLSPAGAGCPDGLDRSSARTSAAKAH